MDRPETEQSKTWAGLTRVVCSADPADCVSPARCNGPERSGPWASEELAMLRHLAAADLTSDAIATRLGRSEASVRDIGTVWFSSDFPEARLEVDLLRGL